MLHLLPRTLSSAFGLCRRLLGLSFSLLSSFYVSLRIVDSGIPQLATKETSSSRTLAIRAAGAAGTAAIEHAGLLAGAARRWRTFVTEEAGAAWWLRVGGFRVALEDTLFGWWGCRLSVEERHNGYVC